MKWVSLLTLVSGNLVPSIEYLFVVFQAKYFLVSQTQGRFSIKVNQTPAAYEKKAKV